MDACLNALGTEPFILAAVADHFPDLLSYGVTLPNGC